MAVLKADAYGHGAVPLARLALKNGADWIGVATLEEGLELRQEGITAPVLIFSLIYPYDGLEAALEANLTPTVADGGGYEALKKRAKKRKNPVACHVKVDTGMGRLWFSIEEAQKFLESASREK